MNAKTMISLSCAALALAACSNNEEMEKSPVADGRQLITLTVHDAQSRAGRELLSSAAGQSVENVAIILTEADGTVVWTKHLDAWNSADGSIPLQSTVTEHGREAQIEIPKEEFRMLGSNTYHIYAYGYSNGSDYDMAPVAAVSVGDSFKGDVALAVNPGVAGEEIFGGDCTVEGNMGGVRAQVVLNRQVAGTFAYLSQIPYVADPAGNVGAYLVLTASNPQGALVMGGFDNVAVASEYKGAFVVNGTNPTTERVVYTIDLSKWYASIVQALDEDGRPTGLILAGENWIGDSKRYKNGTVFGGSFLIPFFKNDAPSLQLKLCATADPATALRTWNVTLPETAPQLDEYSVAVYGATGWHTSPVTDSYTVYNVLRNHLYGIGTKTSEELPATPDDPSNPGNPDDPATPDTPDTPGDVPEPINNKQELTVEVSHNWSAIYNMGVE